MPRKDQRLFGWRIKKYKFTNLINVRNLKGQRRFVRNFECKRSNGRIEIKIIKRI